MAPETLVDVIRHRVTATPDDKALEGKREGTWYSLSWSEVGDRADAIAAGLLALGVEPGQRCAILSGTRVEWILADLGILLAGGATTTVYPNNTAEECAYIIGDSDSVVVFAEDAAQVAKLRQVQEQLGGVRQIVQLQGPVAEGALSLDELIAQGRDWDTENPGELRSRGDAVQPQDLATLIYTSGTTGKPKGVQLTHDNWVFTCGSIETLGLMQADDVQYLFLPLAHVFAKVLAMGAIWLGVPTTTDGNIDDLIGNLPHVRPTVMAAVPRVFEKVYNRVVTQAREAGELRYGVFKWAMEVGGEVSKLRQHGKEPGGLLALKYRVADRLVFSKLKERFGGRIRGFISGGAALSRDIAQFFHAADMLILEGYGMTETTAASFINRPDAFRFGTVGLPLPGVEVRIATDGEILLGGRGIMRGYHGLDQATAEALDDGWMHTGDIGELEPDGFLRITDRKKDLIITAGGKNIAPQNIENRLKATSTYVSQVVMHGDARPYCVALITIDEDTVGKWATEQGLEFDDYASLRALPQVHALIGEEVERLNAELARYETIKKFALLDHDLSIERGELTPKMSVRRKVVVQANKPTLDGFYEGTVEEI